MAGYNLFGLPGGTPGFGGQSIADFGGAAGDIFAGMEAKTQDDIKSTFDQAEGVQYDEAAKQAEQNAAFTAESNRVQQVQKQRELESAQGTIQGTLAGGNLTGGSGQDVLRMSAQQGALAAQVIQRQSQIQIQGYEEQAEADKAMSAAAYSAAGAEKSAGSQAELFGDISGGIKIIAGLALL